MGGEHSPAPKKIPHSPEKFFFTFSFKIWNKKLGYQFLLSPPQVPLEASRGVAASPYIKVTGCLSVPKDLVNHWTLEQISFFFTHNDFEGALNFVSEPKLGHSAFYYSMLGNFISIFNKRDSSTKCI